MKIWERYFIKETIKVFLLIIFCFYGLYILVDYANHSNGQNYFHSHMDWKQFIIFYFFEFVQRAEVLIPFALMIATIKTLTKLNIHNELIALLAGGIRLKRLMAPFLLIGFAGTALIYLNTQFLLPEALKKERHIHDSHSFEKRKNKGTPAAYAIALKNRSTMVFQDYDTSRRLFFDVYWIKSFDEIYRFKYLAPYEKPPVGYQVQLFSRDSQGLLYKKEEWDQKKFPEVRFNKKVLLDTITPVEELSIAKLWKQRPKHGTPLSEKESEMITGLYKKLSMPWLCLLAVLGPAPFCVRFSRDFPTFFIYAGALFALVSSYLMINAAEVLGKRQVIEPELAIGIPLALFLGASLYNFIRLK